MSKHHQLNKRSNGKYILAICVLTALIMVGAVSASVSLPPITLTIVSPNGTQVVLNEIDIGNMTSYRAVGGYRTSYPSVKGLGNYTGVPINTLCDLVGGLHHGQLLRVTAVDNYNITLTYAQVNGDFVTYNATGQQVNHTQPLTTILAYHFNDENLTSGGPLRFAIVGPEGLVTDSTYWVKSVVKLEMLGTASVGGYLSSINKIDLLAPYIGAATIVLVGTVAVGVYRKRAQRRKKQ